MATQNCVRYVRYAGDVATSPGCMICGYILKRS